MHDIRETHPPLWQNYLFVLLNLFGEPHEIAARHTYRRREWALIAKPKPSPPAQRRVFTDDPPPRPRRLGAP